MNFQKNFEPKETFKTTTQETLPSMDQRSAPKTKLYGLCKNEDAVKEYRERWTSGNHNFDRTYLGNETK